MVTSASQHARPALVVLIDRSQSMNEPDAIVEGRSGSGSTRSPAAINAERSRLENFFDVK